MSTVCGEMPMRRATDAFVIDRSHHIKAVRSRSDRCGTCHRGAATGGRPPTPASTGRFLATATIAPIRRRRS
jgi:hypothetical protein